MIKTITKYLSILLIVVSILLILSFFIVTNSFFIKKIILPIVEKKINASIQVEKIQFSPFDSSLEFKNLTIKSNRDYVIKVENFDCIFNLRGLFKQRIEISRLNLENTYINLIKTFNDTLTTPSEKQPTLSHTNQLNYPPQIISKEVVDKNPPSSYFLNCRNITIKNFNIIYEIKRSTSKKSSISGIKNLNLSFAELKTNEYSEINYDATLLVTGINKNLSGTIKGILKLRLNECLFPELLIFDSNIDFDKNTTTVNLCLKTSGDTNVKKIPFSMTCDISNLPLSPLFLVFVDGSYSQTSGNINNFIFNVNGEDINDINPKKNLQGMLRTTATNIVLPIDLRQYLITKIIFIPMEILSNINQYLPANYKVPGILSEITSNIKDTLDGKKPLHLNDGEVIAFLEKGIININTLRLIGKHDDPIQDFHLEGKLNLFNNNIDINSSLNIAGIAVPMSIKGTLEQPSPDINRLLAELLKKNLLNIIETGVSLGASLENINPNTKKIMNQLPGIINQIQNKDKTDTQNNSDQEIKKTKDQLLNEIKSILQH